MTGHDTRRDQIAEAVEDRLHDAGLVSAVMDEDARLVSGDLRDVLRAAADAVMPALDAAVAEARAETAETIARAIEDREVLEPPSDHEHSVNQGLGIAATIARQHGKDQP